MMEDALNRCEHKFAWDGRKAGIPGAVGRTVAQSCVNDLVYTPLETGLLTKAREIGCIAVDGLGMLLHQGAPAFERWFGQRPEVDEELRKIVLQ